MPHTADVVIPAAAGAGMLGVWLGCFAAIERLQMRAAGRSRPFPLDELVNREHAGWLLTLLAAAAVLRAGGVSWLIEVAIAAAYGLYWAHHDRTQINGRFQTWPTSSPTWVRTASTGASVIARVAYLVGATLLAIAVIDTVRG